MSWFFGDNRPAPSATTTSSEFLPSSDEPSHLPAFTTSPETSMIPSTKQPSSSSSSSSYAFKDDEIEYLFVDENPFMKKKERPVGSFGPLPMRTGYDKLNYGTGIAYLCGITFGGAYGAIRGLQIAPGTSYKIRMNSVMNTVTRYGPWAANSLGILTMGWALNDNLLGWLRGKSDTLNHVSAATLTGLIFKSTAGLRPALIAGGLMGGASLIACQIFGDPTPQ